MIKVILLGYGNVGTHLYNAFSKASGVQVTQIYNRSVINSPDGKVATTSNIAEIKKADVYVIAVPDDTIARLSETLLYENQLVVHTSGGVSIDVLSPKNRRGSFYPLQTFSKDIAVNFENIPICLEAENKEDYITLKTLAACISEKIVAVSSEERARLHLAAVFVNNFVNHLYHISESYVTHHNLDFDLLKPLITETARKVQQTLPENAQTGPAKRNDEQTIKKHLEFLKEHPIEKELYQLLSQSIRTSTNKHGKKL